MKIKKLLSILMAVVMLLSTVPSMAFAVGSVVAQGNCGAEGDGSNVTYVLYEDGSLVISGTGEMCDWPEFWNNEYCIKTVEIKDGVTSIGHGSFYNRNELEEITIPNSVTRIDGEVFYNCTKLSNITIPDSVTSIGYDAFYGTAYYNDESNWENGVLYIDDYLIKAENDISGNYIVKDETRVIAEFAFSNCSSLEGIAIPDSVTNIGHRAFESCQMLQNIVLPDSAVRIESIAFYDTEYYNNEANWDNGVLYIGNHLIEAKEDISGDYSIKDGTKTVAVYAFNSCESLKSITIPDSVTYIGDWAFYDCSVLQRIIIPGSVASIGDYAFGFCNSLESVIISEGVETIGENAFYACESLKKVALPESLTEIKNYAFSYCNNIDTFVILSEDITVGYRALPSVLEGYYFVAPDMEANVPQDSNIIPFTYEDNVLSFSYNFAADSVYFLDLITIFCMYYGADRIIDSVKFKELHLTHQNDDKDEIVKNVEVKVQIDNGEIFEPCSFTRLCFYNSNQSDIVFMLIASSEHYYKAVEMKTSNSSTEDFNSIPKHLKAAAAIVMLLNKLFSFFRLFTN